MQKEKENREQEENENHTKNEDLEPYTVTHATRFDNYNKDIYVFLEKDFGTETYTMQFFIQQFPIPKKNNLPNHQCNKYCKDDGKDLGLDKLYIVCCIEYHEPFQSVSDSSTESTPNSNLASTSNFVPNSGAEMNSDTKLKSVVTESLPKSDLASTSKSVPNSETEKFTDFKPENVVPERHEADIVSESKPESVSDSELNQDATNTLGSVSDLEIVEVPNSILRRVPSSPTEMISSNDTLSSIPSSKSKRRSKPETKKKLSSNLSVAFNSIMKTFPKIGKR